MPIDVSTSTDAALAEDVTKPRYLVQLGFETVQYLCTREDVTWNGQTWTGNGVQVGRLFTNSDGGQGATIELPNADNAYSSLVFSEGVAGRVCKIWVLYGDAPFADEDAVPVFDGVMDACDVGALRVQVTCIGDGDKTGISPNLVIGPPVFNHLPAAGTVLYWGNGTYKLEAER